MGQIFGGNYEIWVLEAFYGTKFRRNQRDLGFIEKKNALIRVRAPKFKESVPLAFFFNSRY